MSGSTLLSTTVQRRLAGFILAIVLAAGLLGWVSHAALRQGAELSETLVREQLENFRIADQFETELHRLRGILGRFEIHHDRTDWSRFQHEQKALDAWLDERRQNVTTAVERSVLEEIDRTYNGYFITARSLDAEVARGTPWLELAPKVEETVTKFEELGLLAGKLLKAHRSGLADHLDRSRDDLGRMRGLLFGALAGLLVVGGLFAVVVWRDMIQPLRLRLIESEDLIARQEKLASLGVLAAGVAHEIRNPLTAIKARLFTQRKQLATGTPAAADAEVISGEIDRLELIVRGFLAFAQPARPEQVPLVAGTLMREVQELLGAVRAKDGIRLELEPAEGLRFSGDPAQLKQVLINLVQNAAEAIGRDGTVTLRARSGVHRLRGQPCDVVLLEVADTGPGVALGIRERLFDPFFTTKESGTGLGLAIALRIVEKHGGAIELQTVPGRGAMFGVVIPVGPGPRPAP